MVADLPILPAGEREPQIVHSCWAWSGRAGDGNGVSTESGRVEAREEASETGRLEAFSDGVFAIAVTLLVLDLHVPLGEEIRHGGLIRALLAQWPIYLAYVLSFITILIFWVNHHATFKHITRTNQAFLILNGLLLLAISVIPFTTALLAEYIQRPERKAVEVVYSGTFVVAAVVYNRLWFYATRDRRLTSPDADMHTIDGITRQFHRGLAAYALSFVVAFFSAEVSLAICILLAIYFALPSELLHGHADPVPAAGRQE